MVDDMKQYVKVGLRRHVRSWYSFLPVYQLPIYSREPGVSWGQQEGQTAGWGKQTACDSRPSLVDLGASMWCTGQCSRTYIFNSVCSIMMVKGQAELVCAY